MDAAETVVEGEEAEDVAAVEVAAAAASLALRAATALMGGAMLVDLMRSRCGGAFPCLFKCCLAVWLFGCVVAARLTLSWRRLLLAYN